MGLVFRPGSRVLSLFRVWGWSRPPPSSSGKMGIHRHPILSSLSLVVTVREAQRKVWVYGFFCGTFPFLLCGLQFRV